MLPSVTNNARIRARNYFQEITKELELLILTPLLQEKRETKAFPLDFRRVCFALLFKLQPMEFLSIFWFFSGVFGAVLGWSSCLRRAYLKILILFC